MKLAFIVQRYGREILGGSETLARQLAERLARRHEITVLTTTAKDYITWKNEYKTGEDKLRGVRVHRFPVEGERDIDEFNKFSDAIYKGKPTREQELEWIERQGPVCPELIEFLKKEHDRYDLLIFFTYLYYPTYYGLQVAPEKSVLVPTAHDEPPLRFDIFKQMFQLPSSFLFNTEAEELLVLERFPVHKKMRETVGMGMELLDQPDTSIFKKRHDVSGRYFLYAGRIDGGKGLEELFRFFTFYKEEHPATGNLQLILIGKLGMKLPDDASIRYIGFVDEAEKLSAMAGAVAVMQPSRMESLSIVTLEAFSVGTPIVASAASRVLVDHCKKANAGFYYSDFEEFEEILSLMLGDRNLARSMGKNGQRYVKENYGWQKLLSKYELVLRASARPSKDTRGSRRRDAPPPRKAPEPAVEEKASGSAASSKPSKPSKQDDETPPETGPDETQNESGAETSATEPPSAEADEVAVEAKRDEASSESAEPEAGVEDEPGVPAPGDEETVELAVPERAAIEASAEDNIGEPTKEVVESEVPEETDEEPEEVDEEPEEVDEDVAHLPSFFQSSLPPKATEPPPPEPEPKPEPPPPEKPAVETPPLEEGELPEFFRPKPPPEAESEANEEEKTDES